MMEKIRVAANHIVVKIIFVLIILSFIFAGVGGIFGASSGDDSQYIAKVDGEGLSRAAFEAQASVATQKVYSVGGDDAFTKEIRRGVLANQIDNYIAYNFSNQLKTTISNEKVKDIIRQNKIFFENGKFSNQLYLNILALNGYTPDLYAEGLRAEVQQIQAMSGLINSEFVLPVDSNVSVLQNQVRTAYVTTVNPSIINKDEIVVSDDEVANYYNEHLDSFFLPERVKIKFIANYRPDLKKSIDVSKAEIENEYEKNSTAYTIAAKHAYSVIEVRDQETADEIYNELAAGANFTDRVKSASQALNVKNNGFLGWFDVDDKLPQVLVDAGLKEKGTFSKPIQTDDGFFIVRLDDIRPQQKMPLEYASPIIRLALFNEKVDKTFEANNELLQKGLSEGVGSLDALAEQAGLPTYDSEWSYRNERFTIVRFPEVNEYVFNNLMMNDNQVTDELSDIIYVENIQSTYVIQIVDYRPEGIAPFDDVKAQILDDLKSEKAKSSFHDEISHMVSLLEEGKDVKGVSFEQRYDLSRDSTSLDKDVIDMVFSLVPSVSGDGVHGVSFSPNDQLQAAIAVMIGVNTPTDIEDLSEQLRPEFIGNTQYYLANDLRSKVKIDIMPNSGL